jgi:DnaJ-class molecular chaperone
MSLIARHKLEASGTLPLVKSAQSTTCPKCNDSGWVPVAGDSLRVEACDCQGDLRRRQRFASTAIPKRYSHCTLETFK